MIQFPYQHCHAISIHKALAGLDGTPRSTGPSSTNFNPQGPRGPRPAIFFTVIDRYKISIHKALAGLDVSYLLLSHAGQYFNPQGPRGPRQDAVTISMTSTDFNPQGPRGPRPLPIHTTLSSSYFNPQGPRGPRLTCSLCLAEFADISIHKALAGLDHNRFPPWYAAQNFNPQGPRGPRPDSTPSLA